METQQQSANSSEFKPETSTPSVPVGKPFPNFQPMLPEKMDTETLTAFIASNAKDLAVRSEFLKPYYLELRSRIPQKEWDKLCKTTFDRTRRAIDYWLAGGNPVSKRKPRPDLPSEPEPAANAPATTTFNVADSPAAQEVQTKIDDTPEAEVQPAASDPLAIAPDWVI